MSEGNIPIDYNFKKHPLATQLGLEKNGLCQIDGHYIFAF